MTYEEIVAKMKEYLAMETELEFKEFEQYYRSLIEYLNKDYQSLEEEDLVTMRYILTVVNTNAVDRGARKDKNFKKFRKMAEKVEFWADAIKYKLTKEMGHTDDSLDDALNKVDDKMHDRVEPETADEKDDAPEE